MSALRTGEISRQTKSNAKNKGHPEPMFVVHFNIFLRTYNTVHIKTTETPMTTDNKTANEGFSDLLESTCLVAALTISRRLSKLSIEKLMLRYGSDIANQSTDSAQSGRDWCFLSERSSPRGQAFSKLIEGFESR